MINAKDIINKTVKTIPNKPGVYRMLDENGEIIYIGKAKNLKKRIKSYSRKNLENKRIKRMAELIRSIEFTTTENEENALLLEVNLIKAHKPKYNILMRDDKDICILDNKSYNLQELISTKTIQRTIKYLIHD